jgi:hypothetical protein
MSYELKSLEDRRSDSRKASLEALADSVEQGPALPAPAFSKVLPEPYFFSLKMRCSRRRTATTPTTRPFFKKAWTP